MLRRRKIFQKVVKGDNNGCKRFDAALKGYGGCPMAHDTLVGNMATENVIQYFEEQGVSLNLNRTAFAEAINIADKIFRN